MTEKIVIGVDVGGTFTDVLAFEEKTGRVSVAKTPSTKEDQSKGFLEGILKTTNDLSLVSTIILSSSNLLLLSCSCGSLAAS